VACYRAEIAPSGVTARHVESVRAGLVEASRRVTMGGQLVIYLGDTLAHGREPCFCFFEAPGPDVVRLVNELVQLPTVHVEEVRAIPARARIDLAPNT
jgi:hypothetical protein